MGWFNGSVGKGAWCQVGEPEFDFQDLDDGKRTLTLTSCPQIFTSTL